MDYFLILRPFTPDKVDPENVVELVSAPEKSASVRLQFMKEVLERFVLSNFALVKSHSSNQHSLASEPLNRVSASTALRKWFRRRSDRDRLAKVRSAPTKPAARIQDSIRIAPRRFAPSRHDPRRSTPERSLPSSSAPRRSLFLALRRLNSFARARSFMG